VRNTSVDPAEERRLVILIAPGGQVRLCDPRLALANNPQGCV
jgi:type IV fimbrial biogenesis protein FimT